MFLILSLFHALRIKHDSDVEVHKYTKAVELKNSPEVREIKNGPLKVLTQIPSPMKTTENPPRAQGENIAECPVDGAHANLSQCTLIFLEKQLSSTNSNTAEAKAPSSAAQDRLPDISALLAQTVCAENHTEINTTMEYVKLAAPDDDGEDTSSEPVEAEACGQVPRITEVLSQPNTQLPPIDVVSQEEDEIFLSW